ncbi:prepilin peptidase [Candidatus Daviesbacteria bacterium]|nr:prepilin peptidase [Candidatus Daviesbacteria bacterium]
MLNLILGFLLGICLGSFVKVLADRSVGKRKFSGRSYCEHCKKKISWYDLIPIFSYLNLHGRCRNCQKKIGLEYLLIEIITGVTVATLFFLKIPDNFFQLNIFVKGVYGLDIGFGLLIIVVLLTVFITDIKTGLIPDRITYPAIKIAFIYLVIMLISQIALSYIQLKNSPLGQYLLPPQSTYFYSLVYPHLENFFFHLLSSLGLAFFFGSLIFITRGRGMGGGDFKLGIFMGLALGFPSSLVALLIAFFSGSIIGILLLTLRLKNFGQTIPFGPFLSIGGIVALFWGEKLWFWYLNTLSLRGSVF